MQDSSSAPKPQALSTRERAFNNAFNQHAAFFRNYFLRKTGNQHDADDLLLQLWESVYAAFAPEQFSHIRLLQRRADQVLVSHLRKRKVRSIVELVSEYPEMPDLSGGHEIEEKDSEARLCKRFWEQFPGIKLTETEKAIFWMKARFGYTLAEIAERYKTPVSTVQDCITGVREACSASLESEKDTA